VLARGDFWHKGGQGRIVSLFSFSPLSLFSYILIHPLTSPPPPPFPLSPSPSPLASRYSKRSSSARWDIDELSLVEKRTYKSQMGFAGITPGKKTA
jgi:hypothetical protein